MVRHIRTLKYIVLSLATLFVSGCDTEDGLTCLKTTGDIITEEITLDAFQKIIVFERVQLFVEEGPEVKVQLETGENLRDDISLEVDKGILSIRNEGACNLFRPYGVTKVRVTHPNITEIRNSSGLAVESVGVIGWEQLRLVSDDLIEEDFYHKDGDFKMTLNTQRLEVQCNGLSNFFLKGSVDHLDIQLLAGDSRLPIEGLEVQQVTIFHSGTNDVIVAPLQSIRGTLSSTGNLILKNVPEVVEVETLFTGRLIIDD
ncbi:MAG: hypothetical protein CL867_08835 [Cytophagaceae bacterium]|nr:hypothetical protein [Cytophagaceae bacterium]